MIWTYRVFRDQNGRYSVREVFYARDGALITYGKAPVALVGDSPEEVLQILAWGRAAFDLPILSVEAIDAELAQRPPPEPTGAAERLSMQAVREALALDPERVPTE